MEACTWLFMHAYGAKRHRYSHVSILTNKNQESPRMFFYTYVHDPYIAIGTFLHILFSKLSCRISPFQSCYRNEILQVLVRFQPIMPNLLFLYQSFVSPAPLGRENSGAFNFSNSKALVKAPPCGKKSLVKFLLKAPVPRGQMT